MKQVEISKVWTFLQYLYDYIWLFSDIYGDI